MDTATRQYIVTRLFTSTFRHLTSQEEIGVVQAARIGLAVRDLAEQMLAEVADRPIRSLDEVLSR